jgi:uncharacterized protein GlcG (DUF336 family)
MRTRPALTLADVKKIAAAAEAEAIRHNWIVAIAIVDDGGHLMIWSGSSRHVGAPSPPRRRAPRPSRRTSGFWEEHIKSGACPCSRCPACCRCRATCRSAGACVGAVGVSGVQSHEDEQIAANASIKAVIPG